MSEQPTDQAPAMELSGPTTGGMAGITPIAQQYLDQTRPWVRFMSIMHFVGAGFMLLVGIAMLGFSVIGGVAARNNGEVGALRSAIGAAVVAVVYVFVAFLYVAPGVYLSRYASAITYLKTSGNAAALEDALKHQKSFWRYIGILTVVALIVAVVGMVLAVVAGALAAAMAARS